METNEYFTNKEGKKVNRQRTLTYLRIMGYYRPIQFANIGKRSEAYSRKYYLMPDLENNPILMARANAEFNTKYE